MSRYLIVWLMSLTLVTTIFQEVNAASMYTQPSAKVASQRILVTYVDRSIERKSVVSGGHRYRSRGEYQTTVWGRRIAGEISSKYKLELIAQWPITELGIYCVEYKVPEGTSVESILDTLRNNHRIESAQPMHEFHTLAQVYNDPYYRLQENIQLMHVEAAHRYSTGKNVKIVVIDTGIEKHHPDLLGQIVDGVNFLSPADTRRQKKGAADFFDAHGTAVAGVIGALADNGTGIVGIAPDAKLVALNACLASESHSLDAICNSLTLALALNTAIRMKPDIVNMSLGGPEDPLLRRLIDRALDVGIVVVAATSTEAKDGIGFPASMERVIAVSNEKKRSKAVINTIVAPGLNVLTTIPNGSYEYVSGSSISAATVSGLIALQLQLEPELLHEKITDNLENSLVENQRYSVQVVDACEMLVRQHAEYTVSASVKLPIDCSVTVQQFDQSELVSF